MDTNIILFAVYMLLNKPSHKAFWLLKIATKMKAV